MLLKDSLAEALSQRILILDGAMGTMLQRHALSGNSEQFNLTHPDIISAIHREYIEAGADIIETNSFSANSISQAEYGRSADAPRMALAAARIARQAADAAGRKVWVAGSMGPTGKSLSLAQDLSDPTWRPYSFDEMSAAYRDQAQQLILGGADILLLETCFDALNTKAAIYAIRSLTEAEGIPVIISVSASDKSGRTLTGQTPEAFYRSVEHVRPAAFGFNCSLGADDLYPLVADAASWASCPVICYPNAGLPNEMGRYEETPAQMASAMHKMALAGIINIAGGCCGTTPEHIRAIRQAISDLPPRVVPAPDHKLHVSGLEALTIDRRSGNFTNIGERTNVAGSRKFARLIASGSYDEALQVAASQIEGGANIIDVNMDDAMLDPTVEMEKFLRCIAGEPSVARAALMIDSSRWEAIVTGLKNAQGRSVVNSISLKEGEDVLVERARQIADLGAAVVVMAFDEQGQATTLQRKIDICRRAYVLLTQRAGLRPEDIIFDVNVLSVGTGIAEHAAYGTDFIEAVRWIKSNLSGSLTSGGISNLSFAFRGNNTVREAMHSVFLYHAIGAGLDMGIVNPSMLQVYDSIEPGLLKAVEDVILNRDPDATERLLSMASAVQDTRTTAADSPAGDSTRPPVRERLAQALIQGRSAGMGDDLMQALSELGSAVAIIEGPLMDGMARVGELFADGKMFLPQVVKSAKVMRDAVAVLEPYMQDGAQGGTDKPRFLIATVRGDVHDIGKNITAIVLRCNGFDVTDLGVMVPAQTILEQAEAMRADIIGVSGLITPSLHQMEELCKEMSARGMDTPLLVGGATTSALHTAVKLAPLYGHVFHRADASASAVLASQLMSDRQATEERERSEQARLRALYEESHSQAGAPQDTPASGQDTGQAHAFDPESYLYGKVFEDIPSRELSVAEVLPYFDWKMFDAIWGIRQGGPTDEEQVSRLHADARAVLDGMSRQQRRSAVPGAWPALPGGCRIMISARFDECHSEDDCIVGDSWSLPMLRQAGRDGRSLCDFVAPAAYGRGSAAGIFAVSVHSSVHAPGSCDCASCPASYGPMLERSVRVTLAEAASSWLSAQLEERLRETPGIPQGVRIIKPAAGYASCPDHTIKRDILSLLPGARALDISLTESYAMIPDASICGLVLAHPRAFYPDIRHIGREAVEAYAARRGMSPQDASRFLDNLI